MLGIFYKTRFFLSSGLLSIADISENFRSAECEKHSYPNTPILLYLQLKGMILVLLDQLSTDA